MRHASDKDIPYRDAAARVFYWLLPANRRVLATRPLYSLISIVFHIAIIITPIFLAAHVRLWERGVGLHWWTLPGGWADALTWTAMAGAMALLVMRLATLTSRRLTRFQDVSLLLLIALVALTGYLASHPEGVPITYQTLMLLHVMGGNLLMVSIPVTKLAHAVLLPTTQVASEVAWHFPPEYGEEVVLALGRDGEPI